MLSKISFSAVVLCAIILLAGVSAVPAPDEYPEVIPGPGMPSLESLGLTSKDLYNAIQPERNSNLLSERVLTNKTDDSHRYRGASGPVCEKVQHWLRRQSPK